MNDQETYLNKLARIRSERERLLTAQRRIQGLELMRNRKQDSRKRYLVGALVLTEATTNSTLETILNQLLASKLIQPKDRALFGLPPCAAKS